MASMLQVKGVVSWGMGDTRQVSSGTRSMVRDLNNITEHGANQANRSIARSTQQSLETVAGLSQKSGERLLKQKKQIAEQGARAIEAVKPKPIPAGTAPSGEIKKREREINTVLAGAEKAHSRFKKMQAESGIGTAVTGKTATQDMGRFYAQDRSQREAQIDLMRRAKQETADRLVQMKEQYEKFPDKRRKAAKDHLNQMEQERAAFKHLDVAIKQYTQDNRSLIKVENIHADTVRRNADVERRIMAEKREMEKLNYQMTRERLVMQRQVGEEIDKVSEQVGTTLRNAFMYATVAMAGFYYKLNEVVEIFKGFEAELINAQSIWQTSNEQLYEISDTVVQFGQKFGINMGQATEGLYQYASAGVEAAEAMEMLSHTLTLSMAVQGDHNTLSKLTTQTILGFSMEFSDAAMVTDKFAHAINKSLIEWDDLASSIKFALPFFISTGQSLDQLLGALEILTNRALEAGIAGRGLRQALAEFTQHADDNAAAFHKMGVEILDNQGNMRELTDIALQFQSAMGDGVNDMEIMMALMEDLNIRGATAFVHLVQNADEYQQAVDDLANSAGSSAEMAEIQQKSLVNQIQLVKNALLMPFLLTDEVGESAGYINEFQMELHRAIKVFEDMITTGEEGNKTLTEFGQFIKDFVVLAIREFVTLMHEAKGMLLSFSDNTEGAYFMLNLFIVPLRFVIKLLGALGTDFMSAILLFKVMNKIIPLNTMAMAGNIRMRQMDIKMMSQEAKARVANLQTRIAELETQQGGMKLTGAEQVLRARGIPIIGMESTARVTKTGVVVAETGAMWGLVAAQMASKAAMFGMIFITQKWAKDSAAATALIGGLAGAVMGLAMAKSLSTTFDPVTFAAAAASGFAIMAGFNLLMRDMMKPPKVEAYDFEPLDLGGTKDLGGRMMYPRRNYATGGAVEGGGHFPVMVEAGETIIPKTQNMLAGGGGVTVVVEGNVYDSEDFAETIAVVLPEALRKADDVGAYATGGV